MCSIFENVNRLSHCSSKKTEGEKSGKTAVDTDDSKLRIKRTARRIHPPPPLKSIKRRGEKGIDRFLAPPLE